MSQQLQTQRALHVTKIDHPLTLATSQPIPHPGPHQLQARVSVAGLNPHDQKSRDRGLLIADHLPAILGNDVVGTITSLGSDVDGSRFKVGDRVVGQGNGLQEFALLEEDFTAVIPESWSDDEAATLPVNLVSSMVGLFDTEGGFGLGIPPPWDGRAGEFDYAGTTILIIGGGSNCGRFAVQLASMTGVGRIVVVGGDENELKGFGASEVIDRHGTAEELMRRIKGVVGDELVYAFDTVGPPELQFVGINALSSTRRGKLARLVSSGEIDESKIQPKTAGYDLIRVFGLARATPGLNKVFWAKLSQYMAEGMIRPSKFEVIQGLDVDQVNKALDRYRDGERVVKPHVHVA